MASRRMANLFLLVCLLSIAAAPTAQGPLLQSQPPLVDVQAPLNPTAANLALGISDANSPQPASSIHASPSITLTATGFEPGVITVTVGAVVTWYNATDQTHVLTSGEPFELYLPLIVRQAGGASRAALAPSLSLPQVFQPASESFGGAFPPGGSLSHTFDAVGFYPYYLATAPHIRGQVVVTSLAPPLDRTVPTTLYDASEFLYTGDNPLQTGVAPGTIDPARVVVIRGRVLGRDEGPLPGVQITILGHAEFGQTLSRDDGMFDMAVNGGGVLTVQYTKEGCLSAQRQVDAPWQDYVWTPDVVLVPLDPLVTTVDLSQTTQEMLVAQGSVISDTDGIRQATLLVPQGTQAALVLPGGVTQTITSLDVRLTEYTVGDNGPQAMPAELPPNVAYTYAAELSADEALAAGATDVQFDRPLYFYVDDFLGFPVGGVVPTGYYDKEAAQWVASENGRVVEIVGITGGLADLDTDGDGVADNGLVITSTWVLTFTAAERQTLAELYPETPQTLWRVPVTHFTPWDCNWSRGCTDANEDGIADCEYPDLDDPELDDLTDDTCESEGHSIIECQNQVLGERVPLAGVPFSLNYRSSRVPGRKAAYQLNIPLTGDSLPIGLQSVSLRVRVAGQSFHYAFPPAPNQSFKFTDWDGRDAWGRLVQGAQPFHACVGYGYEMVYGGLTPDAGSAMFAAVSGTSARDSSGSAGVAGMGRTDLILWRCSCGTLGAWDARAQGLGGWSLDVHHSYDFYGQTLYLGDGSRRSTDTLRPVIRSVAGGEPPYPPDWGDGGPATEASLERPQGVAAGPDGSLYIADTYHHTIRRVTPEGIITRFAGSYILGFAGDGGPAVAAKLNKPSDVALGPDGSLYIADYGNSRIRRVGTDGIITTVAGGGVGYCEGCPATDVFLLYVRAVTVAPDGSLFIAHDSYIRRVGPDGRIWTVAGTGSAGYDGDGGPATEAQLHNPRRVALAADGSLYIADSQNHRIRRVGTDGIITTTVGTGTPDFGGDGGPATLASLNFPQGVVVAPDGSLYISDRDNYRVRRVGPEGNIATVAGRGSYGFSGDGGPATRARLNDPQGVAWAPDGSLLIADEWNHRIRQVHSPLAGFNGTDLALPAQDGGELYDFTASGRHQRTLHAFTGASLYEFGYDESGLLVTIQDGDGNVTTVERDAEGDPTAIVGPYGQRTTLSLDANGYLAAITNPAGEAQTFSYTDDGLLTGRTDARGNAYAYAHDELGRLVRAEDPAGGFTDLAREEIEDGYQVSLTTALGRTNTYAVQRLPNGDKRLVNTFPGGPSHEMVVGTDGGRIVSYADGTLLSQVQGPDPRWGMLVPVPQVMTVTMPSGLVSLVQISRTAVLADPVDPLSMESWEQVTSANGRDYATHYDVGSHTFTFTTPAGRQATIGTDARGRPMHSEAADLEPFEFSYDAHGRLSSIVQGSGASTRTATLSYGLAGSLSSIVDPLARTVSFVYDLAGRVTSRILPGDHPISYSYHANGNLASIAPPDRPPHEFTYSALNLIRAYIPPDVGGGNTRTEYTYDPDRQLSRVTRPDGQVLDLSYDPAGWLIGLTTQHHQTTFAYDALTGNLTNVDHSRGVDLAYVYDGALVTGLTWAEGIAGTVTRVHDADSRVIELMVNGGSSVTLQYDADGLLTRAGDLVLNRSPQSGLLTDTVLGSVNDTWGYNAFGESTTYSAYHGGTSLLTTQFTRDKLGRITQKTETIGGATDVYDYTYDLAGRLIGVQKNSATVAMYTYDGNGNRLSFTGPSGTVNGIYDEQDRLLQYGSTTYTYTANGELLSKTTDGQTTGYEYDALGNLLNVSMPNGTQIEYLIDGTNRRVGKTVNGVLVQGLLYEDALRPIAELDGAGNLVSRFVYGTHVNIPEYMIKGGSTYRFISDHLGSPRLVVDTATGEIAQRMDYDEFGNVVNDTHPGFQPFGFAGGLYDGLTGLTRFGARDYDADVGRWVAKDPLRFLPGDPNLYLYVGGDSLNATDAFGMFGPSLAEPLDPYLVYLILRSCLAPENMLAELGHRLGSEVEIPEGYVYLGTSVTFTGQGYEYRWTDLPGGHYPRDIKEFGPLWLHSRTLVESHVMKADLLIIITTVPAPKLEIKRKGKSELSW